MKDNNKNGLFSLPVKILIVLVPVVIRVISLLFISSAKMSVVFFASAAVVAILLAADAFKADIKVNAFSIGNNRKINVFAACVSFGFFAEFVNRCVSAYYVTDGTKYLIALSLSIRVGAAIFALLSSVYFVFVALYFSNGHYDFHSFKVLHLAPVLWAVMRLLEAMEQSGFNTFDGVCELLKYLTLAASLFFFFAFAREVENEKSAKRFTLLMSKELAFLSVLYLTEGLLLLKANGAAGLSFESLFYLTALSLCLFSLAFERNLLINTDTEN